MDEFWLRILILLSRLSCPDAFHLILEPYHTVTRGVIIEGKFVLLIASHYIRNGIKSPLFIGNFLSLHVLDEEAADLAVFGSKAYFLLCYLEKAPLINWSWSLPYSYE